MVLVAALRGIDAGFDGGRGGGEDYRCALQPATHHSHIAGVVGDAIALLVSRFMLFIDDQEF